MNQKKYILLLLINILIINNAYATSRVEGDGKVQITIIDNSLCFSTINPQRTGKYYLTGKKILDHDDESAWWKYENDFEVKQAAKSSCILWGEKGFLAEKKYVLNTPYRIMFSQSNNFYTTAFCLAQKEGQIVVQEVENNQCYEPPKGMWQLIKEALGW